jgi:hypothetical protein
MATQSVRRTKWVCDGAAPFIASHPCDDARDELIRVTDIYGWSPDRVWRGRRGIVATFGYARVFIVAPQKGN